MTTSAPTVSSTTVEEVSNSHASPASNSPIAPTSILDPLMAPVVIQPKPRKLGKVAMAIAEPGPGLTAKNFAMRKWLETNSGGLRANFEVYFKSLSEEERV
ncbi:hypothetical protein H0H92_002451, partial [Tricholoma furcatifolium]